MRIENKLPVALATVGVTLFGSYAMHLLHTEERDLQAVAGREMMVLGRSLGVAVENALRDGQVADIDETLTGLDLADPGVDVVVLDALGRITSRSAGAINHSLTLEAAAAAVRDGTESLRFEPQESPTWLLYAAPLRVHAGVAGSADGAIVVTRPLTGLNADLDETRRGLLLSLGVVVVVVLLVGKLLSGLYLGRPLSRLIDAMRGVRSGDLRANLPVHRADEVGEVATEFNALVAALKVAQDALREREARERQLRQALQDADKLVTVGQLAAGLAHEIGSPLQVLTGRSRALLDHAADVQKVLRHAEIMVRETERITAIVEQLMRFARRRPPRQDLVDLGAVAAAVVDLLDVEARVRHVRMDYRGLDGRVVRGDADQLHQVVLNLLRNALEVSPPGGSIRMSARRSDRTLTLEITDDGPGIAEDVEERLFEPFFTTRSERGGTGLGLAVVRSIVEDHGGRVSVRRPAANGSASGAVFAVELPAGDEESMGRLSDDVSR